MSYIKVDTTIVPSNLKKEKTIEVISDIHDDGRSKRTKKYHELIELTAELKPDYITMPGDIIESCHASVSNVEELIKELGLIAPTILSLGNHEEESLEDGLSLDWYYQLDRFHHIYPLNNSKISFDDISFTGFNPTLKTYLSKKGDKNSLFIEEFQKAKLVPDPTSSMHIMLCHSPEFISKEVLKKDSILSQYDLFISGHNHNGCTPTILENVMGSYGLVGPYYTLFPKNSRGLHPISSQQLFVSKGFRKFTQENAILDAIDQFFPNDVHQLVLKKK